ncbi:trypsin-like peptidase domain-containing protein [Dactylosporangium sp. NPDC051541]|uniref:trypsin-like peptidase domain-containing protein n=1 Tax=Dactylosporangium sp. NPDC051541 TaxID=3363977 RepID=UPI0037A33871
MLEVPGFLSRVLDPGGVPVGTGFQVTPGIVVSAWHVLEAAGGGRVGASVRLDALDGSGACFPAEVIGGDPGRDLAVLRGAEPLPESIAGLVPTGSVALLTPVTVTGVSVVDDAGHVYRHLDATGTWQGGTVRDGELALGRLTSTAVVPGMSGAPVRRLSDQAVVGVVSARYNSADGWLRDSVWVARVEDLVRLLGELPGVRVGRRLMLAEPVRTVLSVAAPSASARLPVRVGRSPAARSGMHESALEAARVLIAIDSSCRGLGELGDLVELMLGDLADEPALRARLRRRGLDPRLLLPRIARHDEAMRRWSEPLHDGDRSGPGCGGWLVRLSRVLADELDREMFAGVSDTCRRHLRRALSGEDSAELDAFRSTLGDLLPPLRSTTVEAVPVSTGVAVDHHSRDLASVAAQLCRLPNPSPRLVGRSELIDRIAGAVRRRTASGEPAVAFVSGQPGVGASVVAIEAARRLIPDFPGGVLHMDLNGLVADARRDAPTVVRTISEALRLNLGVGTLDDAYRCGVFHEGLRGRRVLLVLDNALNAAHVAPLVRVPDGCGVIVASRDRVQSYASPGLVFRVEPLARDDSVALLTMFTEGGTASAELLHRIAHLCADVPMALELIGARIASRPDLRLDYLVRILEEESTRLDYLDDGERAVRVAIRLSYDTLDAATQRTFRFMAATPGATTSGAELGHCLAEQPLRQELRLNRLVDRSLAGQEIVSSIAGEVSATFALFDLVLLFAKERLADEPGDAVSAFQRRAVGYLIERLADILRHALGASLTDELDPARFHAAARLAGERGWFDLAVELSEGLRSLYSSRGELGRLVATDDALVELHLRDRDAVSAVAVCFRIAQVLKESDGAAAMDYVRRAGRIAHEHDLLRLAAEADFELSVLHWRQGELAEALAMGERSALALATIGQEELAVPIAINNSQIARELGDAGKAVDWGRRATELAGRWGDLEARASAAFERSRAENTAGYHGQAVDYAREAESLYRALDDWWNAAQSSANGAVFAEDHHDVPLAAELHAAAIDHWERRGEVPRLVEALIERSAFHMRYDHHEDARQALARAVRAIDLSVPAALGAEVLARYAATLLFIEAGDEARGAELATLGGGAAVEDGWTDAELVRLRNVVERFRRGSLSVQEAREQTRELLSSSTRNPPDPLPGWVHEQLGREAADQVKLERGRQ